MKAKTVFITYQFEGIDKCFDYPQNVPLPRIGETFIENNHGGVVSDIRHIFIGDMVTISIIIKKS